MENKERKWVEIKNRIVTNFMWYADKKVVAIPMEQREYMILKTTYSVYIGNHAQNLLMSWFLSFDIKWSSKLGDIYN